MKTPQVITHETFLHNVRDLVAARVSDDALKSKLLDAKLVYGVGSERGARGLCYYDAWHKGEAQNLIEIAASAEESVIQLAGTTVHELAHIAAGRSAGHGQEWLNAVHKLGLRHAFAAGQSYKPADFTQWLRWRLVDLPAPNDGNPIAGPLGGSLLFYGLPTRAPKPCPLGYGTRGGKSRGVGSGSRSVKTSCPQCGYVARVTRKWLDLYGPPTCPHDNVAFVESVA